MGWFVGTATILAFGAPDQRPSARQVADALAACGLAVARLSPANVDARGSTPWFATTVDGQDLFVKVLGRDERDADLLFRVYRFFRLKNVGDQRPFSSLRRAVEHEALVALKARDSGVRTPRVRNVATVEPDGMLLAYEAIQGSSIDSIEGDYDDDLLAQIWAQVALMRNERIAHRDMRRANIFRDADGELWIIDFGFSELAASDRLLQADVAELIAATGVVVGAERAVDAAVRGIGPEAVGASLPMLQPLALAGATHKAVAEHKGLMADLQAQVRERTGVTDVAYEPLARVTTRTALMLVSSLVALYVLIPQLADVTGMFRQLGDANWIWVGVTLVFSAVSYVGASISLMALAPTRVPVGGRLRGQPLGFVRQPDHARRRGRHRPQRPLPAEARRRHGRGRITHRREQRPRPADPPQPHVAVLPVGGQGEQLPLLGAEDADPGRGRGGAGGGRGRLPRPLGPPSPVGPGPAGAVPSLGRRGLDRPSSRPASWR